MKKIYENNLKKSKQNRIAKMSPSTYMRLVNMIRSGRRCIYCRENHDITNCNSGSLHQQYLDMVNKKYDIMEETPLLPLVEMMRLYLEWLTTLDANIVICCARRFCASSSIVYSYCLNHIIIKIWNYPTPSRQEIEYIRFYNNYEDNNLFGFLNINNNQQSQNQRQSQTHAIHQPIHIQYNESLSIPTQECSICYETPRENQMVVLNCNHNFCYKCIIDSNNNKTNDLCCALCREKITHIDCACHTIQILFLSVL